MISLQWRNGFKQRKYEWKNIVLIKQKSFATDRYKWFVQNILSWDGKAACSRKNIWEIGRKWFGLARKSVSTSQNKEFAVKINLLWTEKSFNCQAYLKMQAIFLTSRKILLNRFAIRAIGNRFSFYLEQYCFIWRFPSASANHRGNPIFENNLISASRNWFSA